jgi:DNA repair ATPase RecN
MDITVRYDRDQHCIITTAKNESDLTEDGVVIGRSEGVVTQYVEVSHAHQEYAKLQADKNQLERQLKDNQMKADTTVLKVDEAELKDLRFKMQELSKLDSRDKALQVVENCRTAIDNMNEHLNRLKPVMAQLKK